MKHKSGQAQLNLILDVIEIMKYGVPKMTKKNLINLLVEESKSYMGLDRIEQLIQTGNDLSSIPIQPLYMSMRSLPIEAKSAIVSRLSKEQRTAFLDIDLWSRDMLDVDEFSQWLYVYCGASDELKYEFIKTPEFALFIKARFNIWTFDIEDPLYPDHDYYFLTECNQLLFEYDKDCDFVDQLKDAIKMLYTEEGVENAYSYLFKIVADQVGMMTEDEYRLKKGRLQDYGFIDYYEALELTNTFPSKKHLNNFIKKMIATQRPKVDIPDDLKLQRAPFSVLAPFQKTEISLDTELEKITDINRSDFLNFNFIKLLNANLELNGGIKRGSIEVSKTSKETKILLELGVSYLQDYVTQEYEDEKIIFDIFSFTEINRIGKSLILFARRAIKSTYTKLKLDESFDTFLGQYFDQLISNSFSQSYQFTSLDGKKNDLNNVSSYRLWVTAIDQLTLTLPFAKAFYDKLEELKKNNLVQDHFYLNYNVSDIDFPTLLISSFSNFHLNNSLDQFKIGLTLNEFKVFLQNYQQNRDKADWKNSLDNFANQFGFNTITSFNTFLKTILDDALDGYDDVNKLSNDEFKYIGGPIILEGQSS
jgi:hypothetical protein